MSFDFLPELISAVAVSIILLNTIPIVKHARFDEQGKTNEKRVKHLETSLSELTRVVGQMSAELARSDKVKAALSNNLVKAFNERFRNFEDRILAVQKSASVYQSGLAGKYNQFPVH